MLKNCPMKSRKYVYVGIVAAAIALAIVIIIQFNVIPKVQDNSTPSNQVAFLDFSYDEANSDIRSTLAPYSINMTHPIRLSSQSDVHQYCNFLTDSKKQALVTYCTSAVLKDKEGFLGDVNMVGTPDLPGLVVVALQSNPMMSNYGDVKTVFSAVVNNTICKCWEKEAPSGFSTLSSLVDKLRDTHLTTKDPTTSTPVMPLGNKHFKIELTTNESGYLWKLLVSK